MKYLTLILMFAFLTVSCSKTDDPDPDYVKDENYASWEFDGETYEPAWVSLGFLAPKTYNLYAYRQPQNPNNWKLMIGTSSLDLALYIYLEDIEGIGSYPIETKLEEDLSPAEFGTFLYIEDDSFFYKDLSLKTYFSLGDTGTVEITEYDDEKGILVGTFHCMMYSTHQEGVEKEISGEFNFNLSTFVKQEKPCWL